MKTTAISIKTIISPVMRSLNGIQCSSELCRLTELLWEVLSSSDALRDADDFAKPISQRHVIGADKFLG